jgi:hypothetical protein
MRQAQETGVRNSPRGGIELRQSRPDWVVILVIGV